MLSQEWASEQLLIFKLEFIVSLRPKLAFPTQDKSPTEAN